MKNTKRILAILLALAILLSFAACRTVKEVLADEEVQDLIADVLFDDNDNDSETTESRGDTDEPDAVESSVPDIADTDPSNSTDAPETEAPSEPDSPDVTESAPEASEPEQALDPDGVPYLDPDGAYSSKEEVALYIHQYGCLPGNFITKKQAEALGWSGGSLEPYAPGKSIGGNRFGNYEGLLPSKDGRTYTECDIDTMGAKSRGAKRIVFSNDGLIYYTEDHYESFVLLYGEE